ncbi:uncharacterized protein [Ptychodera flava]|uniref:uncharacterized protein n=1 Tax=Ptychodera flava TaxID=63121 RepID=UPI00396A147E
MYRNGIIESVFLVVLIKSIQVLAGDECSSGWQYHDHYCYKKLAATSSWMNADTQCYNEKAKMVSIHTEGEQNFVAEIAADDNVWIGLNDMTTESQFVWSDGTGAMYTLWGNNQPDDLGLNAVPGADCVLIDLTKANRWYDRLCSVDHHVVCKRPECPSGWKRHTNSNCYKLFTAKKSWFDAQTRCQSLDGGADLAAITDQSLQDFINNEFINNGGTSVWIGVHDQDSENEFKYTTGEPATYFAWQVNQPNDDIMTEDQDCVAAFRSNNGRWEDKNCDDEYQYICEKSLYFTGDDSIPPTVTSCPADISASTNTNKATASLLWAEPTATDNSGDAPSMEKSHSPPFKFPIGVTLVSYTFTDAGGQQARCTFQVTVVDDEPPAVNGCPADITVTAPDHVGIAVSWTPPSATDNSGEAVIMVSSHEPGDFFPIGTSGVTYQLSDPSQNVATCSFEVNVIATGSGVPTTPDAMATATNPMGICQGETMCNISALTIEEVEALSSTEHMSSILLLSITRWMKGHDEVPNDVTNKTSFTWYYLKICSNILHPVHKENWEFLSQIADGPTEAAVTCENLANSFANVTDDFPVYMDFPNIVSRFERVPLSSLPGHQVTFPKRREEDDRFDFMEVDNRSDFESLYDTSGIEASVVAMSFRHGPMFRKKDSWDISEKSPLLSISVLIEGRIVSIPVQFGLQTVREGEVDFGVGYTDGSGSLDDLDAHQPSTKCVFWKPPKAGSHEPGYWSDYGCDVTTATNGYTTCECNHTTSFSVLIQVTEVEITKEHQRALEIITYIGCAISLAALAITLSVLFCLTSLRSERTAIHKNLVVALLAAQILFLSGISATASRVACKAIALLLHYFFMAVFCWMLVEGIHLYGKVVQVFNSGEDKIKHYLSIGWGIPVVVVAVAAAINWEGYGSEKSCWLTIDGQMIWAFAGPATLIILVNLVILAMVLRIVVTSAATNKEKEFDHIKAGVKGALVLLPILGLSWMFGLLAVNEDLIAFQYLFAIFNSLQGFFIFLFQCVLNGEVRAALRRAREKRALERGDYQASSTGGAVFYNTPISVISITNNFHRGFGNKNTEKKHKSTETVMTELDANSHMMGDTALRDVVMDNESADKMSQNSIRTTSSPICVQIAEDQSLLSLNAPTYNHAAVDNCEVVSLTETERRNMANM